MFLRGDRQVKVAAVAKRQVSPACAPQQMGSQIGLCSVPHAHKQLSKPQQMLPALSPGQQWRLHSPCASAPAPGGHFTAHGLLGCGIDHLPGCGVGLLILILQMGSIKAGKAL